MPARFLLGISGGPGSGKSTFAAGLATRLTDSGVNVAVVPMDGFHLPDAVLAERGLLESKGSPETFDRVGFETLLGRLRDTSVNLMAPGYSRESHAVVPDAISVRRGAQVVIVEGNYLGLWPRVRELLDEIWRIDVPWDVARSRLIARRVATGRQPDAAVEWVDRVDAASTALVADSYATRVVRGAD
ncbi:nucleoside/nucleotide kinase family protein [Demequina sp.]|uniref:nucleoside/nucleotide kinase family protein n=1 Tax=Demequina sp. TaxID=2050685 RepID=UPI003D143802